MNIKALLLLSNDKIIAKLESYAAHHLGRSIVKIFFRLMMKNISSKHSGKQVMLSRIYSRRVRFLSAV